MNFKIKDIVNHDSAELIEKLYTVKLKNTNINIYELCNIGLYSYDSAQVINTIYPCQTYLMKQELNKVQELQYQLEEHKLDMFYLNGYLTITLEENDEVYTIDLLPPVIEEMKYQNTSMALINDGMHRIYLSLLTFTNIQVIYIEPTTITAPINKYPYYAYPIVNFNEPNAPAWDKVTLYDELPDNLLKRYPRIKNHKSLYRDFNSVFTGVSGRHISK